MQYKKEDYLDKRGAMKTEALFYETISPSSMKSYKPLYTLKEETKKGLPSAYQIYMQSVDEYDAAMKLVGSMAHWEKLLRCKWFTDGVETVFRGVNSWREDMKKRDVSLAKRVLMEKANDGDISAAKALHAIQETKQAKGRPNKVKQEEPAIPEHLRNHVIAFGKRGES